VIQLSKGKKAEEQWNPDDRLFTAVDGKPIHPDVVTGWFHDFIKHTGLPEVTVHGLRYLNLNKIQTF
jgi:hypothetical protein